MSSQITNIYNNAQAQQAMSRALGYTLDYIALQVELYSGESTLSLKAFSMFD